MAPNVVPNVAIRKDGPGAIGCCFLLRGEIFYIYTNIFRYKIYINIFRIIFSL